MVQVTRSAETIGLSGQQTMATVSFSKLTAIKMFLRLNEHNIDRFDLSLCENLQGTRRLQIYQRHIVDQSYQGFLVTCSVW